jgi:hypothetical protein
LNPLNICLAARIAHGDLLEIDRQLTVGRDLDGQWILLVKLALISVANLTDLEVTVRQIYKEHPEVSVEFKKWSKRFGFAKYVRNILVGHTNDALIAKAIEWKPELLSLLHSDDQRANFLINVFVLETALNTYVDDNERHLVFEGDTDLMHPPDWKRFLIFLTEVVRGGLGFLAVLIEAVRGDIPEPPEGAELMTLYEEAGRTTFKRITKSEKSTEKKAALKALPET